MKRKDTASKIFKLRDQVMIAIMVTIVALLIITWQTQMELESFSFMVAALAVMYNVFVSYVNSYWNEIDNMIVATQPNSPMLYIEYSTESRACAKCSKKSISNNNESGVISCGVDIDQMACVKNEGNSVAKYIRVMDFTQETKSWGIATHMSPQEVSNFEYIEFKKNSNVKSKLDCSIYGFVFHTDFSQRNIYTQILYTTEECGKVLYKEFRFSPIILDRNSQFPDDLDKLINLDYFFNDILNVAEFNKEPIHSAIQAYRREMII